MDYEPLYQALTEVNATGWAKSLEQQINAALNPNKHGHLPAWLRLIDETPSIPTHHRNLNQDVVEIGLSPDISSELRKTILQSLRGLMPWRKGPFNLFGIHIDSEWHSDWKWRRLENHIQPLKNRKVLDVGSGNGYFCWRMLGAQAQLIIGIDPLMLNVMQFRIVRKIYGNNPPVYTLPLGIEDLPVKLNLFDTVFSMGVLYHRRSPIDHLLELKACLRPGGELVLETLIIDGNLGESLVPEGRYANMRNVWFIPSCATLFSWLTRCGYRNIRLVDITVTTQEEQRTTTWMPSQSLSDFLDLNNPTLTCEGLPAPKRAIFIAES